MFYIRTDANATIATGHVMRCLSIAEEMKRRDIAVTFITADHYADNMIHGKGFQTICLDSVWDMPEKEIDKIVKLVRERNIRSILIDSYYVTSVYLQKLCEQTRVIYLDDLGKIDYPVDVLINYNIFAREINYTKLDTTQMLLGEEYVPLRKEFQDICPVFREKVSNVFVSTGGTDKFNVAGELLEQVTREVHFSRLQFHVVSGSMNENLLHLLEFSKKNANIHIYQNPLKVSSIMRQCDIAVSACGFTMYELCACGVPIVSYCFADNQKQGLESFSKQGVAIGCGDWRENKELVLSQICRGIALTTNDMVLRKEMHDIQCSLIDRKGVQRLVTQLWT